MIPFALRAQDSLLVPGRALIRVDSALAVYYDEISNDTLTLSYEAELELSWLISQGVDSLEPMALFPESRLKTYFIAVFDELLEVDTVRERLSVHGQIQETWQVVRFPDEVLGCYEFANADEYENDPGYGTTNSWWIWNGEQYPDENMSVTEAWEFTMSDPTVRTIVNAGEWCVTEAYRQQKPWAEFGSQIHDGITSREEVHPDNIFSVSEVGCTDYDSRHHHAHRSINIIVAQLDDTPDGFLGVAPASKIIPVDVETSTEFKQALEFGRYNGARIVVVSRRTQVAEAHESNYQWAIDNGILPVIAVGNSNSWITVQTHPDALNVAANVGSYKSPLSSYSTFPTVSLCSAGDGGYTSFAAATAAGTAALVLSMYPDMTVHELREKLLAATDPMHDSFWHPDLAETALGTGRLDAYQAIAQHKSGEITDDETWSGPLYIPDDVTIKPGATVTIDLTPVANCENRTHVRFGSLSRTKPPQVIWPKIIVEGTLIVEGVEGNEILFSRLKRNIETGTGWTGQWGGIEVRYGGSLAMNHALLEYSRDGILVESDDVVIENTLICNVSNDPGITFRIYTPTPDVTPTVRNCEIFSKTDQYVGIAVWRGAPLIEHCVLHSLDVGIHYSGQFSGGECRENQIFDTRSHGILCIGNSYPLLTGNTIYRNEGNGISLYVNRRYPLIVDNVIEDNGRAGLREAPFLRTGDGIALFRAAVRLKSNQINDNDCGIRLEFYSTVNGGDGDIGIGGTSAGNTFSGNNTSIFSNDHGRSRLGFIWDYLQKYGDDNNSTVDPVDGLHVEARNHSELWLQCNTWAPTDNSYFVEHLNGHLFRYPVYTDCSPPQYLYPDREFQHAIVELEAGNLYGALLVYDTLARTSEEAVVSRALSGILDVFVADSLHTVTAMVDSVLADYAVVHQNASLQLRGTIAGSQGIVATTVGNLVEADSLIRFADGALLDATQARNNMTQLLYLHLYRNGDQAEGLNVLHDIENRFMGDSLIATARDMYRYYVDLENGGYIIKRPRQDAASGGNVPVVTEAFTLHANYPNPFNPATTIRYEMHEEAEIHLLLTDVLGRRIRDLRRTHHLPGVYEYRLDMRDLRPGLYFCTLRAANHVQTINLLLVR